MATQRIRFSGPPGETITLDIWNAEYPALGAAATHSAIVCVEQTAGDYLTNTFTGTLSGRCKFSKKIGGASIGIDFVTMTNSDGTYVADQLTAAGGGGGGDATAANQATIISHLTDIKGASWDSATDTLEKIRDKETDIETDTQDLQTQVGTDGAGLTNMPWNAAWDTEIQSEVQDAIEANHLDHLLAVSYDPASKPGVSDALLNELIENDGGVARWTANALEQAPAGGGGGGDATAANQATILAEIQKIPRASSTLTAGAQHKRTNQSGDYIRETISPP